MMSKQPGREARAEAVVLLLLLPLFSSAAALTTDGLALLALKSAVSVDPTGALASWLDSDASPCSWTGITCRLDRVVALSLPDRALAGYLPSELSLLSALESLALPGNRLSGPIPAALAALGGLAELDLSRNNLSGPIPPELGQLTSLAHLDLSSNILSGLLPPAIATLPHLSGVLNLSCNLLSGPIPAAFGDIPVDVSLDLRQNNLSGEIPQVGPLLSQGPTAFAENPGLCGFPLKNPCTTPRQDPKIPQPNPNISLNPSDATPRPIDAEKRRRSASTIPILAGVVLASIASILLLQWHFRRRSAAGEGKASKIEIGSSPGYGSSAVGGSRAEERREGHASEIYAAVDEGFGMELEELLRASAYVVGKSRSGIVYKVVVNRGASAVAVRRLSEADDDDDPGAGAGDEWRRRRAFESEAITIGRAKHPNVVRLLAYYYAPDERLLIYDYIPNGTLHAALHGGPQNPTASTLPWATRLNILQGVARGLAYLHEFSPRKHAHGDITSSKILLDDDFRSHISGYGLARLVSSGSHQKLAHSASKKLAVPRAGTGYLAPEARGPGASSASSTQRGDVFAFGVVALEVVTGRPADADLEAWVRGAFKEERPLSEVVDPALLHEVHAKREVLAVFHVALGCTEADPELRPRMRTVAESLDRIGATR
ncbi:receptor protein kinase-like protein ZAR1 [Musa acuminata AAA Group]|uniref:receptor protein kinase-like protein ZAR1 n=1 Tax=Musa acuminata AAA Group TaxID=214697 RepID=UPI0031CEF8B3